MTKIRLWAIFAVLGVALVGAIGYFAVVSPQRAEINKNDAKASAIKDANSGLLVQIARLKKENAQLPEAQAKIAAIDARVPLTPALPSYVRFLTTAAAKAHVELVSVAPSVPSAVTALAPVVPAAPVATAAAKSAATASAAPAAPAPAPASALSAINVSYKIVGNYFQVQAFLKLLEDSPRATVVSSVTVGPGSLPKGPPPPGVTPVAPPTWMTLSAQISATIFMSTTPAATTGAAPPVTTSSAGPGTAPAAPAGSTASPTS